MEFVFGKIGYPNTWDLCAMRTHPTGQSKMNMYGGVGTVLYSITGP